MTRRQWSGRVWAAHVLATLPAYERRNARTERDDEAWWVQHGFLVADPGADDLPHGSVCRADGPMDNAEMANLSLREPARRHISRHREGDAR